MQKILVGALGVALVASTASAIPTLPSKAKGIKGEFVTAYNVCGGGSTTTNPPVVLPACTAVRSNPGCGFGSKGAGKYGAGVSKTDIKVSASLSGLTGCDGQTLAAVTDARVTTDDCIAPDCTSVNLDDFPIGQGVPALGKLSVKTTVETFLGLGTQVFKNGSVYNIEIGETCLSAASGKAFCGGVRVGPL